MSAKEKKEKENGKPTIEEAFEAIDGIIEKLEDENVSLEDAFQEFRAGMEMVKYCEEAIDTIEKDVYRLTEEGETELFE